MGFAVFALKQEDVERCKQRAQAFVSKREYMLVEESGVRRRRRVDEGNKAELVTKVYERYSKKLKLKKIVEFDAPQFCRDWIDLAKKTKAPFDQFEIRYGIPGMDYEQTK